MSKLMTTASASAGAAPDTAEADDAALEQYRIELTGYCYRMLGSLTEAEDAAQEVMIRAWRSVSRFEGRSSLRTWLYRIATNVCLDALHGRRRRALPVDLSPASTASQAVLTERPEATWLEPVPDRRVLPTACSDPADQAIGRDTIRLAFVAALQHLPPRQRAVLILREVLRWKANEVADLLETSVASVNSALQRARATLAAKAPTATESFQPLDARQRTLLARYVDAFERYDMTELTSLLHEDATQSMPPYDLWLHGRDDIAAWMLGPGAGCRGSRLVPTVANGSPAFGHYRSSGPRGRHEAWAVQVVEVSRGAVVGLTVFLDAARLFPTFGLPLRLDS